jgi:hypothetical protein
LEYRRLLADRPRLSRFAAAAPAAILTAEFVAFDVAYYLGRPFGNDARLYLAATQAWLSGGDPWTVESAGIRFAGPPTTLLPFAPFAWLSPEAITVLVAISSVVAAVYVLRRLELPPWWLIFPPFIEALWSGSVNILVLALMLTRLEWLGVVTKTYAGLPSLLLGHVPQLFIAAVVVVLTYPLLPWGMFFDHDLAEVLTSQAWGGRSAWIAPLVLLPLSAVWGGSELRGFRYPCCGRLRNSTSRSSRSRRGPPPWPPRFSPSHCLGLRLRLWSPK